jgi:hypothetical protein
MSAHAVGEEGDGRATLARDGGVRRACDGGVRVLGGRETGVRGRHGVLSGPGTDWGVCSAGHALLVSASP